jgi:hypothetical protein
MDKIGNRAGGRKLIQVCVGITEYFPRRDLQNFASGSELSAAQLRQLFSGRGRAPATRFPCGKGDYVGLHPERLIKQQCTPENCRLIVRMCSYAE